MKMLRAAAAALSIVSLSSQFAAAQDAAHPASYTLSEAETAMGLTARVEGGHLVVLSTGFAQACVNNQAQVAVPLTLDVDVGPVENPVLDAEKRQFLFSTITERANAMLSEMARTPNFPVTAVSGRANHAFIGRMGDFSHGLGLALGLKGLKFGMNTLDRIIVAETCDPIDNPAHFVEARDKFMSRMQALRENARPRGVLPTREDKASPLNI